MRTSLNTAIVFVRSLVDQPFIMDLPGGIVDLAEFSVSGPSRSALLKKVRLNTEKLSVLLSIF